MRIIDRSKYMSFMNKYSIVDLNIEHNPTLINYDYSSAYQAASYVNEKSIATIEITTMGLEKLVMNDAVSTLIIDNEIYENSIRQTIPAVKAAYDQYQMLLKLSA